MSIVLQGSTSGSITLQEPAVAGTTTLNLPTISGPVGVLVSGTSVSASGTSVDFTGIPAGVRRITVMFSGVSLSGSDDILVQLGTGSTPTYTTSGYVSTSMGLASGSSPGAASSTTGFVVYTSISTHTVSGQMSITLLNSNNWVSSHAVKRATTHVAIGGGDVSLGAALTAIRITTTTTNTFDAGTINILYE